MNIILALLIIALLVLVHEWGHFIVARKVGIPVYEFSIGFGFRLFSWKNKDTEYSLRLIPLGGYVRLAGEEADDWDDPRGYNHRTPAEKMAVAFAGPFMNFVLAVAIFIITFAFIGVAQPVNEPIIGDVIPGKPAQLAGLKADDRVLAVNQERVTTWQDFVAKVQGTEANENLWLTVQRDGQIQEINLPVEKNAAGESIIGVYSKINFERQGIIQAVRLGFMQTYQMTLVLLSSLAMLFNGTASASDLAGPVGITSMIGEAAQGGLVYLLSFTAFLSINLGFLNLLPIPALDGSRILFAIIHAIRRKPLDSKREGFIHWLGFLFLMALILLATYNDISRLLKG